MAWIVPDQRFDFHPKTRLGLALGAGLLLIAGTASAQQDKAPLAAVTGGAIRGEALPGPGGASFKGIPYAAPPVGDLRWRETQPVRPWTGVLPTGHYRTGCGQATEGHDIDKGVAEDCLYLNVWAPQWPATGTKRPVMFWINGGELFGGSGALRPGSESLIRKGVVLVSVNYRGTLLGMMGHKELAAESPHHSSANYMLFDEVAALRWVHDNIARFGGDPANVTVFSQSGGAHIVSMLLGSPLAKGLIAKAISDSGSPLQATRPYLTREELEQVGTITAQVLHAPATGQIPYLRSLPANQIVAAMPQVRQRLLELGGQAYDEGTDGTVITRPTGEVWMHHQEARVPLMIGNTAQDTPATIEGAPVPGPDASPEVVLAYKQRILKLFLPKDPDLEQRALQIYGAKGTPNEVSSYPPYGSSQQQLGTDIEHRCGSVLSAALHSQIAPTWLFEFSRSTPGHLPTHGSELPYVFGYSDLPDPAARRQSDIIQSYWTNFAKTGNPNGPGLPTWAPYNAATKASLELAQDGPIARKASRDVACGPYIAKYTRDPHPLTGGAGLYIRGPAVTR